MQEEQLGTRPIPVHLQDLFPKELEKSNGSGHIRRELDFKMIVFSQLQQ